MAALLKYPGAKWGIAEWIISFFPEHHSYLEPFFGSGGVFFTKSPSNIETINDIDGEIINLFECIKRDPERLAHELLHTPYSRELYDAAHKGTYSDEFDRAVQLMIRCNMAQGFRATGQRVGWKRDVAGRERAYAARTWAKLPDKILNAAMRLQGVQIECRPALEVIRGFNAPQVLIYCDPPYVLSTRNRKAYGNEMSDEDHLELLDTLKKHKGPVLISGYDCPLYDAELVSWHRETIWTTDQLSQKKKEVLWMNFEPMEQMTLFN